VEAHSLNSVKLRTPSPSASDALKCSSFHQPISYPKDSLAENKQKKTNYNIIINNQYTSEKLNFTMKKNTIKQQQI
jgi:hypothetical protein